jgi:hypothetical protein
VRNCTDLEKNELVMSTQEQSQTMILKNQLRQQKLYKNKFPRLLLGSMSQNTVEDGMILIPSSVDEEDNMSRPNE